MYPTKMEANGHIYKIKTDYRVAIACFKAIYDDKISDLERFYAVETLLLGENVLPSDEPILREKIEDYLCCGKKSNRKSSVEELDYDYIQDEEDTRISIRQVYHNLDIGKLEYLHWYEYNELIAGLTEDSRISRIREIRSKDLSEITDEKLKSNLQDLKKEYAIKTTKKKKILTPQEKKSIATFYENVLGRK